MKCNNCGRERSKDAGTMLQLTEEDRKYLSQAIGQEGPTELFYCNPCYRVITDRELGARLISGQLEVRLRLAGHPRAQQIGDAMYKFLIKKAATKQVS